MNNFAQMFIQFGLMNTIYGYLFGRPDKFGVRGLYLDDKSVIGPSAVVPVLAPKDANKFFKHTITPYSEYDFIMIDCTGDFASTQRKFNEAVLRLIPGGYVVLRNLKSNPQNISVIQSIKSNPDYEIMEFFDGEGLALVRINQKAKFYNHSVKPLTAGFWISMGLLSGIVIADIIRGE